MDPITAAILAAIAAGAISGTANVAEQVIVDAYVELKRLLKEIFTEESDVVEAVNLLEAKPESVARQEVIKEEIKAAKAEQYPELVQAAQKLLKVIKTKPGGEQIIQTAIGDQNIQMAGNGNTVNVNSPRSKR